MKIQGISGLIFDHHDYKKYLQAAMQAQKGRGRGFQSALAEATRSQSAHISRVLQGTAQLTLEQAEATNVFLDHSADEGHFFLLLVHLERAGTPGLRKYYQSQIDRVLKQRTNLRERFQVKTTLSPEDRAQYYRSWIYSAVHVLLSIPEFQTKERLAEHLGLPKAKIARVLAFLTEAGLAAETQGRFQIGQTRIHLGSESPLVAQHHANWRIQAMRSLDREEADDTAPGLTDDLHYSSIVSLSRADQIRLKNQLIQAIEAFNAVVKESPEERGACLTLDFFGI